MTDTVSKSKPFPGQSVALLLLSIAIQLLLALFFGHLFDMRINMATGYLVGTGQNPYMPQDLSAVFNNPLFRDFTTIGYPPVWPLAMGLLYRCVYAAVPNFFLYNLAIKLPIIAANITLAYLTADILKKLAASAASARKAWLFMLFNPFLLYASSAWGQFDSIVTLIALLALVRLESGKFKQSSILLALAVSLKPTAFPLLLVCFAYLKTRSLPRAFGFCSLFVAAVLLFCVVPFVIFKWDPAVIFHHWDAHFVVGGCMSYMSFFEILKNSYQLSGAWRFAGWLWVPALGIAAYALKPGIQGPVDLLKKSAALVLVFYLTRTWMSEPNIIIILPLVLILTSISELNPLTLAMVWVLPLVFGIFNASLPMLFFPVFPGAMDTLLDLADKYRTVRLIARSIVVVPWLVTGWWIVAVCLKKEGDKPFLKPGTLSNGN